MNTIDSDQVMKGASRSSWLHTLFHECSLWILVRIIDPIRRVISILVMPVLRIWDVIIYALHRIATTSRRYYRRESLLINIVLGVGIWICGYIGFYELDSLNTAILPKNALWINRFTGHLGDNNALSHAYQAIQLFVFQFLEGEETNGWLQFAMIAAPAWTVFAVICTFFKQVFIRIQLMLTRKLVLICGLGQTAYAIIEQLTDGDTYQVDPADQRPLMSDFNRHTIVVIERDPNNPLIADCIDRGVIVLIGDATASSTLRRARAYKAQRVYLLCGDDLINLHTARTLREVTPWYYAWYRSKWIAWVSWYSRQWRGRLPILPRLTSKPQSICYVHLENQELWADMRATQYFIEAETCSVMRYEYIHIYDVVAKRLVDSNELFKIDRWDKYTFVGWSAFSHALFNELLYQQPYKAGSSSVVFIIVDDQASAIRQRLIHHSPELKRILTAVNTEPHLWVPEDNDISCVVVAHGDDSATLATTLLLCGRLRAKGIAGNTKVAALFTERARLSSDQLRSIDLVHDHGVTENHIECINLMDIAAPLSEPLDIISMYSVTGVCACIVHRAFIDSHSHTNIDSIWMETSQQYMNSNVEVVLDLPHKLQLLNQNGYDWDELYSEEHERWKRERYKYGWCYVQVPYDPNAVIFNSHGVQGSGRFEYDKTPFNSYDTYAHIKNSFYVNHDLDIAWENNRAFIDLPNSEKKKDDRIVNATQEMMSRIGLDLPGGTTGVI